MATKITVALEDDLDGSPADETGFGRGGAEYEIDLNKKNELDVAHAQLRGEVPYGDPALHGGSALGPVRPVRQRPLGRNDVG